MKKRICSVLLAVALAAGLAQPVFANGDPTLVESDTIGGAFTTPQTFADTPLTESKAWEDDTPALQSPFPGIRFFALPPAAGQNTVTLQLYMNGSSTLTTQTMSWRDALAGILNAEVGGFYGKYSNAYTLQAWTAQAVAIHSYLLYNNCNTTSATSEVYRNPDSDPARKALLYQATDAALDYIAVTEINSNGDHTSPDNYNLALTSYYASAGMNPTTGARGTANSQDVWLQNLPYLQGVASPYDEEMAKAFNDKWERYPTMNYTRWEELISEMNRIFGVDISGYRGSANAANAIKVTKYSTYGYVPHDGLSVGGRTGLDGQLVYTKFKGTNWSVRLSSGSYKIDYIPGHTEYEGSAMGTVEEPWHLTAYGNGHGVGLSQYGALGYAVKNGWSAWQILAHYYPGIRLYNKADKQFYAISEGSSGLTPLLAPTPTPRPVLPRDPGDIVDDGGLTLRDLLALAGHLSGRAPLTDEIQLLLADMNEDGTVNAADLQLLTAALLQ